MENMRNPEIPVITYYEVEDGLLRVECVDGVSTIYKLKDGKWSDGTITNLNELRDLDPLSDEKVEEMLQGLAQSNNNS